MGKYFGHVKLASPAAMKEAIRIAKSQDNIFRQIYNWVLGKGKSAINALKSIGKVDEAAQAAQAAKAIEGVGGASKAVVAKPAVVKIDNATPVPVEVVKPVENATVDANAVNAANVGKKLNGRSLLIGAGLGAIPAYLLGHLMAKDNQTNQNYYG